MTLPSYVINFDELANLFDEQFDSGSINKYTYYNGEIETKSFYQQIPAFTNKYIVLKWELKRDIKLMSIAFSQNAWKEQDSWSLFLNEKIVIENAHTKELTDKKHWEIVKSLKEKDEIVLILDNVSGNSRGIWVDFTFLLLEGDD